MRGGSFHETERYWPKPALKMRIEVKVKLTIYTIVKVTIVHG